MQSGQQLYEYSLQKWCQMQDNDFCKSCDILFPLIFNNKENHQKVKRILLGKRKMDMIFFMLCPAFTFQKLQVIVESFFKKGQIYSVEKETPTFLFRSEKCLLFYRFSLLWNCISKLVYFNFLFLLFMVNLLRLNSLTII